MGPYVLTAPTKFLTARLVTVETVVVTTPLKMVAVFLYKVIPDVVEFNPVALPDTLIMPDLWTVYNMVPTVVVPTILVYSTVLYLN